MKYLDGIKIGNWQKFALSTVSEKHTEVKKLRKAAKRLRKTSQKKAVEKAILK